ncbi:hypothetical protein CTI12_AA090160 [Artemisia annua]|uniref:SAM domain-containing protein n=1 Tax=Artemisia annua TaxID=35608 RepID=A0A2U1Q084_ARTAN|nr:hypothetical protein CTI12_AA090160 [Artemisia annua]
MGTQLKVMFFGSFAPLSLVRMINMAIGLSIHVVDYTSVVRLARRDRASSFHFRIRKLRVGALDRITKKLKVFPKNELIERFLEILGMHKKYSLRFRRHKITLPYVTDENLKSLGIRMGPRTTILNASRYL